MDSQPFVPTWAISAVIMALLGHLSDKQPALIEPQMTIIDAAPPQPVVIETVKVITRDAGISQSPLFWPFFWFLFVWFVVSASALTFFTVKRICASDITTTILDDFSAVLFPDGFENPASPPSLRLPEEKITEEPSTPPAPATSPPTIEKDETTPLQPSQALPTEPIDSEPVAQAADETSPPPLYVESWSDVPLPERTWYCDKMRKIRSGRAREQRHKRMAKFQQWLEEGSAVAVPGED